jgi:hypothetical protein
MTTMKSQIPQTTALDPQQIKAEQTIETIKRLRRLAHMLDNRFTIPGTDWRVGWDAIIGLIPGIGDVITAALAGYIIYQARELGVPKHLLSRMMMNVAVDATAGAVPIVGDLFDIAWRANAKNVRLLERYLRKRDAKQRKMKRSDSN